MTQLYTENYAHCAPFEPQVLLDVWRNCGGDRDLCQRGAETAQRLLLGDTVPRAEDWLLGREEDVPPAAHLAPPAVAKPAPEEDEP